MVDGVISHVKRFNDLTTQNKIYLQRHPHLLNLKLDQMRSYELISNRTYAVKQHKLDRINFVRILNYLEIWEGKRAKRKSKQ